MPHSKTQKQEGNIFVLFETIVKYRFTLYLKELHCHLTSLFIHKLYCTNLYQKVIEAMPVSVPAYSCRIGVAVKDICQSFYSVRGVPGSRFS